MSLLRYVAVLVLGIWVGGLAVLGAIAAPMIFSTLETQDPAAGRELAGVLFGDLFGRFQYVAWGLGVLLILSLALRAALGPRPRRLALRIWMTVAMMLASAGTMLLIVPRINAIRTTVHGSIASLPDTDGRKTEFGRLHGLSNVLMLLTIGGGLGLLWGEVKDQS